MDAVVNQLLTVKDQELIDIIADIARDVSRLSLVRRSCACMRVCAFVDGSVDGCST